MWALLRYCEIHKNTLNSSGERCIHLCTELWWWFLSIANAMRLHCTSGIPWTPATAASQAQQIYWAVSKETLWYYYLRVQKRSKKVHTRNPTTARAFWTSVGRTCPVPPPKRAPLEADMAPCPQRELPLIALPAADISLRPITLRTLWELRFKV